MPVKAVLPVRIDSSVGENHNSREAGKVHRGLALSFGRACRRQVDVFVLKTVEACA